jgi:hypothetical protein
LELKKVINDLKKFISYSSGFVELRKNISLGIINEVFEIVFKKYLFEYLSFNIF